jgi:NADH-quinone oxidoreductase subunit E
MLRRLHAVQPASFEFTPANLAWAKGQMSKYPEGRQASAIIPLLWRAQEQEGWLSRPAIEHVSAMLGLAYIRGLEVATFYFMFQLQPVGSVAHIQICGTTSCMICGAEELTAVCKEMIAKTPHTLSADGKFSWEEVECLGACANAPMAQIGKDYYEDLTAEGLRALIGRFALGQVPLPGSQIGRYAAEPAGGLTTLVEFESGRRQYNASVQLAADHKDTVKRIDGSEVPLLTPWLGKTAKAAPKPKAKATPVVAVGGTKPKGLTAPRKAGADDLTLILGIGPKLAVLCNRLGFYHFDQIAAWSEAEIAWVDDNLEGFKGRVTRDKWVAQARILAAGGTADEAEAAARG